MHNYNIYSCTSRKAAEKMKLLTINYDNFESVSAVSTSLKTSDLVSEFPKVFDNKLGSLPGVKVHLTLAPNAEPVVRPPRTLPESLNATVKMELDRLDETGVIIKADWVSQMSVVKKRSGAVRICIDPRPLNLSLTRAHFKLLVLDDILSRL